MDTSDWRTAVRAHAPRNAARSYSRELEDRALHRFRRRVTVRNAEEHRAWRSITTGRYMRLMRGSKIVMSNTSSEMNDLLEFGRRVTGDVLLNRLGLGIAVQFALAKPEVSAVTVIDVIGRASRERQRCLAMNYAVEAESALLGTGVRAVKSSVARTTMLQWLPSRLSERISGLG